MTRTGVSGRGPAKLTIVEYSSSATYTMPLTVTVVEEILLIGGGGSGSSGPVTRPGAGGAAGYCVRLANIACNPGWVWSFTVGIGGAGVTTGADAAGNSGGDTTLTLPSGQVVTANGGGAGSLIGTNQNIHVPGNGGSGGGGVNLRGGTHGGSMPGPLIREPVNGNTNVAGSVNALPLWGVGQYSEIFGMMASSTNGMFYGPPNGMGFMPGVPGGGGGASGALGGNGGGWTGGLPGARPTGAGGPGLISGAGGGGGSNLLSSGAGSAGLIRFTYWA